MNPGRDLGGAEHSLLLLLRELLRQDVAPTVALFGDGPFAASLATLGVPTAYLLLSDAVRQGSRYRPALGLGPLTRLGLQAAPGTAQLVALATRLRADVVHTNGLKAHLLGGVAGRLALRPVVWHLRDFPPAGPAGKLFGAGARLLPRVMLANSAAVAAAWRPGAAARRVRAIGNPVDLARFNPAADGAAVRAGLGIAPGEPLVGMIAHLTPWKGHEAFLRVVQRLPGVRGLVCGGAIYETAGHAGYEEQLRRLAADLGIAGRVHLLGNRDDVPGILAALDVLVHVPAAPEPFGRVVAEAMAVGKPVVAARAGGLPEIVQHEETGLLVPPGDEDACVAAVTRLLGDPALRARLGAAARRSAELRFDPALHAARVIEAYKEIT